MNCEICEDLMKSEINAPILYIEKLKIIRSIEIEKNKMLETKEILILCFTTLISFFLFKIIAAFLQYQKTNHPRLEVSPRIQFFCNFILIISIALAIWILTGQVAKNDELAAWMMVGLFFFLSSALLIVTRKWYIELHENCVIYNRGLGKDRIIYFQDICSYRFLEILAQPHVKIKNQQGWTLDIPLSYMDQHPLKFWIDFHQKNGRFPTPIELKQEKNRQDQRKN